MKIKRLAFVLTVLVMMGTVLAGFGSAKASPVKIEFFNMKREIAAIMDQFIAGFEKENPDIVIEQNVVPDPAIQVLQTRMASGDTPELFSQWPDATWRVQVKEGFMLDLSGDKCLRNIQDSVLKAYRINGKDYIAPISYNTVGVFYNKKIFSDLKLSVPQTWSQLLDVCKKIKAAGKVPFIMQGKNAEAMLQEWYTLLPAIPHYDQFITESLAGELQPASKSNLRKIAEKFVQIAAYSQPDALGTDYDQGEIDFANEKGAMLIMGSWIIGPVKKANPNLDFAMFPMPADTAKGVMAPAFPGDFALCVSAKAKHPEECKKFIRYVTRTENAKIYAEKDGSLSCIKNVTTVVPQLTAQYAVLKAGKFKVNPDVNWIQSIRDAIGAAVQKLIIDKDIDEFVNAVDKAFKLGVR